MEEFPGLTQSLIPTQGKFGRFGRFEPVLAEKALAGARDDASLRDSVIMHRCGADCGCSMNGKRSTSYQSYGRAPAGAEPPASNRSTREERLGVFREKSQETVKHELAHEACAGQWALGPPVYNDEVHEGEVCHNGGHVNIDTSPLKDPQATINKMKQLVQAALAPDEPSGQDFAVAASCSMRLAQAQLELATKKPTVH